MDKREAAASWDALKREIIKAAPSLGIDDIGFASAEPFLSLRTRLEQHRAKGFESGFEEPDLDKRTYPALSHDDPQSLVAIAVAYPSKLENPPKSAPGQTRGMMARSAWGRDYHLVLREAMDRLVEYIKQKVPWASVVSMVDTGVLSDRAVAHRAGIGFQGKNCMIISPKYGSWIYLGELITNIPFTPDEAVQEDCGDCTRCIDACPTGALVGPGELNAQRCVSFLTQTKGLLSEEFMMKIGNRLYGCDTCQIVCPKNKGKHWPHHEQLQPDPEKAKPLLLPLLDLSNRQFKERFGDTAAAWRGRGPIQRNAVIALGNFKDETALPKLGEVLQSDPRPVMRGTAAWSIGRIGGSAAEEALLAAQALEQDAEVLERIALALSEAREGRKPRPAKGDPSRRGRASEPDARLGDKGGAGVERAAEGGAGSGAGESGEAQSEARENDAADRAAGSGAGAGGPAAGTAESPAERGERGQASAAAAEALSVSAAAGDAVEPAAPEPAAPPAAAHLFYDEMQSPIGPLLLTASESGLCRIDFGTFDGRSAELAAWTKRWFGAASELTRRPEAVEPYGKQIFEYLSGRRESFDLPLDLRGTPFQVEVWNALRGVGYGETASYKRIAEIVGRPAAVRAVGGANNRNPLPLILPCHRIVGAGGKLVGYAGGLDVKEKLLALEKRIVDARRSGGS
ncbi:tRNA epoxyqueuosine(34) reductase QueG [Saccharibacillus sp. CPCC 101409]|uniref:tRNA epoxyqueuosine(34) reductase QueG n=1 Tax=Saccharibacillus sp. CPCC 101409 TaxID=3058041 RepID=UPI00267268B1|nr:tRNA epoxyqueuosine(34) reductase QueG [Saccharibacillus sp. CPCC 101409]MDO3412649.1 tRNA epoxyqueuosine(34) reductase QueG [Saccharibacillus sp. CPCC 101409]